MIFTHLDKVKNKAQLKRMIRALKAGGKRIVFTNGCFDLLHYGHVKYLQQAKLKGDVLIVGLNSDFSVQRIKGKNRPLVCEKDRAGIIAALSCVDWVVLFKEDTPIELIKLIKPDVLVKGSDWRKDKIVGGDFVLSYGGEVLRIKLLQDRSTTKLIKRIVKSFAR